MKKDGTEEAGDQDGIQVPWLVVLETVFVLVIVTGLGLWSVPVAMVVGGLLGVLACERALADWRAAGVRRGGEWTGGERQ